MALLSSTWVPLRNLFIFIWVPLHFSPSTKKNCKSSTMLIFPSVVSGSGIERKCEFQKLPTKWALSNRKFDIQIQLWCAQIVPKQYCLNKGIKLFEFWCYLKDSGCINHNKPRGLEKVQLSQSALSTRSDKYLILIPKSIINHFSKRY